MLLLIFKIFYFFEVFYLILNVGRCNKDTYEKDLIEINKMKKIIKDLNSEFSIITNNINNLKEQIYKLENKKEINKIKNEYRYFCPSELCNGFLNNKFICDLCNLIVCKNCYSEKKENHECDPKMKETFDSIKKDAKPCPSCGQFISKIDGCDQMFCINCGSAFSWKTGIIEKGIIHNPHAHTFFQNILNLQDEYINRINNCQNALPVLHRGFNKPFSLIDGNLY